MTTVAEVRAELEAFKVRVVEVAVAEGKKRNWCSELQRVLDRDLGLLNYLPHEFVVQIKRGQERWGDYGGSHQTLAEAITDATGARGGAVANARDRHRRARTETTTRTVVVRIDPSTSARLMANRVAEAQASLEAQLAEIAAINAPFVEPEYPKFRVVERRFGQRRVLAVHEIETTE